MTGVSDFVVITGMSGAGRSQAGNCLEDLGWFVIDNLPPELIPKVANLAIGSRDQEPKLALAVGAGHGVDDIQSSIAALRRTGARVRVIFLDSSTEVLVRRYESTKRRHPLLQHEGLGDAIERERDVLRSVRESADLVIDTSSLSVHELKHRIVELFSDPDLGDVMQTTVMSFGFKHGVPGDVDIVLDCRFLPNPYWNEELRPLSGLDRPIVEFLDAVPETAEFLDRLEHLLELLVPAYRAEGKSYLTIALGCTGGHHRSVAMAEALRPRLARLGVDPRVTHRDVTK